MLKRMYAIKDLVAEEFGPVQFLKNDGIAWRMFHQAMENVKSDPHEFQLFFLGTFDSSTGGFDIGFPIQQIFANDGKAGE